jgi:ketosteroid isomerase-like protein
MSHVEDDLAIRDLVYRYADAVCRRDEDAWGATWAEDGVWQLSGAPRTEGRAAIVQLWLGAMSQFPFVAQIVHSGMLDIDGEQATGRWYLSESIQFADGNGMQNIGCYQDRYVKRDGQWLFAERHYAVLYNDEGKGDMTGTANPFPPLLFE